MKKILLFLSLLVCTGLFAQDKNFHIYLCLGQSNMEGNAKIEPQDTCGISDRFRMMAAVDFPERGRVKDRWYKAVPPLVRSHTGLTPVDYFGRVLLENLPDEVRVGVINVAIGGCRIELFDEEECREYIAHSPDWLKNSVKEYDNNPYQRLVEMARLAQKEGVIKGILLHQGESNAGEAAEWPIKVKGVYERLLSDLNLKAKDVPLLVGEVVHAEQGGICASMNATIDTLPRLIPTAHVISSAGCCVADDHLHFSAAGYRMLGARYAEKMLSLPGYRMRQDASASQESCYNHPTAQWMEPGKECRVSSPDGRITVTVSAEGGQPSYRIDCGGVPCLESSPLGLETNIGDFTRDMTLLPMSAPKLLEEAYDLPNGKQSHVSYQATEAVCSFTRNGKPVYDLILRVSNRDVAFRYRMFPQGDSLCCVVLREATGFRMPEGTTTFLCPQSGPMGGFARTSPSYETPYTTDEPTGRNGWGEGYTFPCLFRNGDKGWMLISETGVNGTYCGGRLIGKEDGSYVIGFPQPGEMNGNGTPEPGLRLPGETPWRTITLGETLAPIVETTVSTDLVTPLYEASKEYQYGRGVWSWIIGMDESITYDEQKRYIDFCAAMGYESVLVDNWWDKQIGRDRIAELAHYAAGKNVALYLWYNSNGYWNDAPQTPRGCMDRSLLRRREMAWLKSIGIRGIKVDFFAGDKQATMQLYEDILADANDFGLLVIFHGCTLPRGWERMYPNFASAEAVLASENLYFSQGSCDAEAFNATLHPFIRNTVAPMDFGGSTLNKFYHKTNAQGSRRMTSDVFALSAAILFQSPVQHFALSPENLTDAPAWAIDFMKQVPTTWNEVKFIDGYPGKYIILARRHGDKWYIAGVNAQQETVNLRLTLPMLQAGSEVQLYSDDTRLEGSVKRTKVDKRHQLTVSIPCNGGVVIIQ